MTDFLTSGHAFALFAGVFVVWVFVLLIWTLFDAIDPPDERP